MCLLVRRIRCCSSAVTILLALTLASTAANASPKPFSIDSEEAPRALLEFGRQSTLQILFATEKVKGIVTNAVHGNYEPIDALRLLLKGTPLVVSEKADGVLVVQPQAKARNPVNADPVSINNDGSSTRFTQPGSGLASNASTPNRDSSSVSSGPDNSSINEITVTAQKREERLQNVPISISVLSTTQLERPAITSVTDALNTVPGVAANQAYLGGATLLTIRGVASGLNISSGSNPIAYYLDSVPFGLVKSTFAPDEDAYDLERVEVLRGPQGTLYGASALNGVVRILSTDADLDSFDFKARGTDSYTDGGGNNYSGDMAVNVPIIDGKLAVRAVVGYGDDSGWINSPLHNNVNDDELRNYRLKVDAKPTDDLSIGLSYWGTRDNYGAPSTGTNDKTTSIINQPIVTDFDTYGLKVGYDFSGYTLSSSTSHLQYSNASTLDFSPSYGYPIASVNGFIGTTTSEELTLNSPLSGAWRWTMGGMYRQAREGETQYDPLTAPISWFDDYADISKSGAIFGELTRVFLDGRFELTAGLRQFWDQVTQTDRIAPTDPPSDAGASFHDTSPRLVATWHASDDLMIYGSYSKGFRSGFPQNAFPSNSISFPPVKADSLYNYETGAKGALWDNRVQFDAAVYYMDWVHVQQEESQLIGNAYYPVVVNGQSASGPGIDVAVTTEPATGLTLGVNASWNDLRMDSAVYSGGELLFAKGARLNYSPETTAGASAAYEFPLSASGWTARVSASDNYISSQVIRGSLGGPILTASGDPMAIGRAQFSVKSPKHWTTTLFVNNFTNERGVAIRTPFNNPNWNSSVRPMTTGLQFEYHLK